MVKSGNETTSGTPEGGPFGGRLEQAAEEWVRTETGWVDTCPSDLEGTPFKETWLCEANDCKRAYLAGATAERERIWAEITNGEIYVARKPIHLDMSGLKIIIFGGEK